ncbi:hypothetical protein [Acetobacterium malicum]|uniref:hypothetical protein n=1 Tax=Acetobacterium malicum TaxID=52692 RepID=UPI0003FC65E5|nr:hypothetical protein [Acetobacterium dehalogenans]
MKIILNNKVLEFENKPEIIEAIFNAINTELEETGQNLHHLVIDKKIVDKDFYDYFLENVLIIENVEVVVEDLEKLVNETLRSTSQYLSNAIFQLEPLAEAFYKTPEQETWGNLADFFEGIGWIMDTAENIDQIKNLDQILADYKAWNNYVLSVRELLKAMPGLEEALTNQDQVLIGDLLLYEVLPVFTKAQETLNLLVTSEGDTHVS